jgi:hypothetical protein
MPAHRQREEVYVQARKVLEAARAEGLPFDLAWQWRVIGTRRRRADVRYGHATEVRKSEREILTSQREVWRDAYEGRASSLAAALDQLLALLDVIAGEGMVDAPEVGGLRARLAAAPAPVPRGTELTKLRARARQRDAVQAAVAA